MKNKIAKYFKVKRLKDHPALRIEIEEEYPFSALALPWEKFAEIRKEARTQGKTAVFCLTGTGDPKRKEFYVCLCSDDFTYDEHNALVYAQDAKGEFTKIVQDGLVFQFKGVADEDNT